MYLSFKKCKNLSFNVLSITVKSLFLFERKIRLFTKKLKLFLKNKGDGFVILYQQLFKCECNFKNKNSKKILKLLLNELFLTFKKLQFNSFKMFKLFK